MVKTLLIYSPLTGAREAGIESQGFPLGLGYLAAYLKKNGFEVKALDCLIEGNENKVKVSENIYRVGLSEKEIEKRILEIKPDIIGISCLFTAYEQNVFEVAEIVKKVLPDCLVVVGGAHASGYPESVLKNKNIDLAVIGEGEETFLEIVKKVKQGKQNFEDLKGIAFRKNGKTIINSRRELIKNLDEIPFPLREIFPMQLYFKNQKKAYPFVMSLPVGEIVTSRGCPNDCIFCSIKTVWGKCWRGRTAKNVVDEIEFLYNTYHIREFNLTDDNVSMHKKRMIEICEEILKRKLKITWQTPNGIAIWTLDEPLLKLMKKTGYYRAKFGIESGSLKTLKYIEKPVDLKQAKEVIRICNKLGIWTASAFLIGFPDENIESINQTIDFAVSTDLDFARFMIPQPYAGTRLKTSFEKFKLLPKGIINSSSSYKTKYNTKHFTAIELNNFRVKAHNKFLKSRMKRYLSPTGFFKYLYPKISSIHGLRFFLMAFGQIVKDKASKRVVGN
ncbi:MAG: cobalamin-dependent protein [archaeon]